MWKKRLRSLLVSGSVLLLGSCGGDPTGSNTGDELTDVEVQAILTELGDSFANFGAVPSLMGRDVDTPVALPRTGVPVDIDINASAPCESGSIGLNGSIKGDVDENDLTGGFNARLTWTINGCVLTVQETAVTVDGDPSIVFDADFTLDDNSITAVGTEKGGFRFSTSDGRTGTCAIDLSFNVVIGKTGNSVTSTTTGTVCGRNADAFVAYP